MRSRHQSQVRSMSGRLRGENREHLGVWRDRRGQKQDLALGCAGRAAVQRSVSSVRERDQMIGAERLATTVAMELVAAGAQHFAAGSVRARVDFEEGLAAVLFVLDRKTLEKCVAGGAGSGSKSVSHTFIFVLMTSL